MKEFKWIGLVFIAIFCISCSSQPVVFHHDDEDYELTQQQESQALQQLFKEIETLAHSKSCENAEDWAFTSYGSKACGGPVGYMAYSKKIDTALLFHKIETHRLAQQKFNEQYEIVSDCSIPEKPKAIKCVEGKPTLVY